MATTLRLKTTIINPSAVDRFYAYVTPRGRKIAAGGSYTVDGDIRVGLKKRYADALDAHIAAGQVVVLTSIDGDVGTVNAAAAAAGLVGLEHGGPVRRVKLQLTNVALVLVDNAGVVAYAGLKLYTFGRGLINFLGASASLSIGKTTAGVNTTFRSTWGLGTVTADTSATLSSTEQNLIPSTAAATAVAGVATLTALATSTEAAKVFNGSTGTGAATSAFLNVVVTDADHDVTTTPCNLLATGTITIDYAHLGDA